MGAPGGRLWGSSLADQETSPRSPKAGVASKLAGVGLTERGFGRSSVPPAPFDARELNGKVRAGRAGPGPTRSGPQISPPHNQVACRHRVPSNQLLGLSIALAPRHTRVIRRELPAAQTVGLLHGKYGIWRHGYAGQRFWIEDPDPCCTTGVRGPGPGHPSHVPQPESPPGRVLSPAT